MADITYIPADWERLKGYVRSQAGDDAFVQSCWAEATQLVEDACKDVEGNAIDVPISVRDRAKVEVGSELFHRRQAPNGVAQFATADGNPVRVARDPMVGAWPILRPYIGLGIG
jgi:hypothetical protein